MEAYLPVDHHGTVNCRERSGDLILRCYERLAAAFAAMGRHVAAFAHGSSHWLPLKLTCVRCGFLHRFAIVVVISAGEQRLMANLLTCAFVVDRVVNG